MEYTNTTIADHLQTIAFLFQKAKEPWKSQAFSRVAEEVRGRREPLKIEEGTLREKIDGVGKAIKDVIEQFVSTGTSLKLQKLHELLPNEVYERFEAKVCKRKVTEILAPLPEAGIDWGYAGSMRRGSKTVRDVDVIVCLHDESERKVVDKAIRDAGLDADVRNGQEKVGISVPIKSQARSFTLDLNFTEPHKRGAHYLYFTGPKAFNIEQRRLAKSKGLTLNQKGLWKGKECLASETEEEIFEALGMEYLSPSERS